MLERPKPGGGRADRILDAAGALLLRLGYRKVTIEDIARHADIGKGTVYLHWRTRDQLFQALMLRESISLLEELLALLRADCAAVVPHRFVPASFLASLRRPLIVAVLTGDTELLGKLKDGPLRSQELLAGKRFYELMIRCRLLRDDVPDLAFAMQAAATGFYLIGDDDHGLGEMTAEAKAAALAHTIRHAFEPPGEPDPPSTAAAAAELAAVFEDLIASYRSWIYGPAPAAESG